MVESFEKLIEGRTVPVAMETVAVCPMNPELCGHKVIIYDSTLRDGEQTPGVAFSREQKIAIARKLDEINVPQIEAGFPAVSRSEVETIRAITSMGLKAENPGTDEGREKGCRLHGRERGGHGTSLRGDLRHPSEV